MVENRVVKVNFSYWSQYRTGKEKSFISSILIDNLQKKTRYYFLTWLCTIDIKQAAV